MPSRTIQTLCDRRGFTLIEMLVTVGLVGVISAVAATNFNAFFPPYRTRGAALQIAGDLNFARLSAVKEGRRYSFVPQAGTSYQISYTNNLGNQVVVKNVTVAADYPQVRFGATGIVTDPYGGAVGAASPAVSIVFNSDGTVTNAAPIYVEPTTVASNTQNVVWMTSAGRIRVWHFDGTTWR
jgi:prepilin-type N-terminal cleavage/methylation domain-containing protein